MLPSVARRRTQIAEALSERYLPPRIRPECVGNKKGLEKKNNSIVNDWKITCATTDECSTGILKPLARWWLNKIGRSRNYGCGCVQHDFDYRFGPKYGISKRKADAELREYVAAAGHQVIAWAVWSGLLVGGWVAWRKYRANDNR